VLLGEPSPLFVRGSVTEGTTWQDVLLAADACGDMASVGMLADLFVSITQGWAATLGSPWIWHDVVPVATGLVPLLATAVELRAQVIEVAYRFFQMPRSKRVQVIQQDADQFLDSSDLRKPDVIFADLYHGTGVDTVQLRDDFIARCAALLKDDGWLVLNCWNEHREDARLRDALRAHFTDIRTVMTSSRNWVILAGKVQDWQTNGVLKDTAFKLSASLGFPLLRHLGRMRGLGE
jgi:hypothetical protein